VRSLCAFCLLGDPRGDPAWLLVADWGRETAVGVMVRGDEPAAEERMADAPIFQGLPPAPP